MPKLLRAAPVGEHDLSENVPRRRVLMGTLFAASASLVSACLGIADERPTSPAGRTSPPVSLRTRIPLPGVYGRIDHYGWDSKRGLLLVAALGNDTVEIIGDWKRRNSIAGLEHPQAVVYLPTVDRIAVSSQSGKLRFYEAANYALVKTLDFGENANVDNMRYDALSQKLYVGYGSGARGSIAVVDPKIMERLQDYTVGSHPEAFQLETGGSRMFVNLPDQGAIGVVDRATGAVTKWKIAGHNNVHAMALDEDNNRLFTASLQPGRFTVVDTNSGAVVATLPCVLGVDDIWFDSELRRLYAPGSGAIDVFEQVDPDHYSALGHVVVDSGAGSTSFRLKTRTQDSLFMSLPNALPQGGSEVLLFYVDE
jgi:hypothetical protein